MTAPHADAAPDLIRGPAGIGAALNHGAPDQVRGGAGHRP